MKSKRQDGRGHWASGKRRSPLGKPEVAACLRKLRSALAAQSIRAVARTVGVSDMCVRRVASGEDVPSARTAQLVAERL